MSISPLSEYLQILSIFYNSIPHSSIGFNHKIQILTQGGGERELFSGGQNGKICVYCRKSGKEGWDEDLS
jgi:hypothetical protein